MKEVKELLVPARVVEGHVQSPAPAFHAVHVDHEMLPGWLDPFLLIDHFDMNGPFFAPHPHAGFSVCSYLFEDSEGEFSNRDTLGEEIRVAPGGLLWAHTGGGMMHEENPAASGPRVHGLQTWVNVAPGHKHAAPQREAHDADEIPYVTMPGGVTVHVLAGTLGDARAPGGPPTAIRYLEVRMPAHAEAFFDVESGHNAFAFLLQGTGATGPEGAEVALPSNHIAAFGRAGGRVRLRADARELHLVLASGKPLDVPIAQHGPFVGATQDDLKQYFERYRMGKMGRLG
jgi:redox-sensitive bicupin YhaK (pirin superfamily)